MDLINELYKYQDLKYRDFHSSLIPNIDKERFIGVRTPILRKIAKEMINDGSYKEFIKDLPHYYYEENTLHSCILSEYKELDELLNELDVFLPYIDNWATCDLLKPKAFNKDLNRILDKVKDWINTKEVYSIRFAIVTLLSFYLDVKFDKEINEIVLNIENDDYYVKMAQAWYFSFALMKQYDSTIEIFIDKKLDKWIHNKSIQKAIESYQINPVYKSYLRSLKIK
ncbi:MAG: DNA alkylation repair protein [Bacilli bacterium]|nr:DNA alkylation repair protein [Bacilli bacterium]